MYSATVVPLCILLLLCHCVRVSMAIPPAISTGGHGFFAMCSDLSACFAHDGETGTDQFAQVLTRNTMLKKSFPPVSSGI